MKTKTVNITPEVALEWLEKNTNNRPVDRKVTAFLVEEITAGRWKVNGDAIRFDTQGNLIDGQHRLYAIAKAGVAVESLVIHDLESGVFDTIDCGKRRSVGDALTLAGESNAYVLGRALSWLAKHEVGTLDTPIPCRSATLVQEVLKQHPGIRDSIPVSYRSRHLLPSPLGAALHYIFSGIDKPLADEMFDGLATGFVPNKADGFHLLRERLLRERGRTIGTSQSLFVAALAIKAWNTRLLRKSIEVLKWTREEPFPKIQTKRGKEAR